MNTTSMRKGRFKIKKKNKAWMDWDKFSLRKSRWDVKPATHLEILYANRRDRGTSPDVPGAAIFADRRDRRIKPAIHLAILYANRG